MTCIRATWRCGRTIGLAILALFAVASPRLCTAAPPAPTYEADVLPLFKTRCLGCHGGGQPSAGLDVRALAAVLHGGKSGPAVEPGSPAKSVLYQMVASGNMPPTSDKLSAAEVARVAAWIRAGAHGNKAVAPHWAFLPPTRAAVPHIAGVQNPIDSFLLGALQKKGLAFSAPADRRTLLRRVTLDLIGLPPTPAEMDAFLADGSPGAYGKVVDRLLADPRYGERWARDWLDTAGYADSEGILEEDRIRPNAWRYRDYVIRNFNEDRPYDRFLLEQIAGDELVDYRGADHWTPAIDDAITATGFLRTSVDATRDDFNPHQFAEYQYRMLNDTQTILVSSTLGLTMQCARCHDHKYEPITQRDYYGIQAILAGAIRPGGTLLPTNRRQIVAATLAEQKHAKEVNSQADAAIAAADKGIAALLVEYRLKWLDSKLTTVPEPDRAPLAAAARAATPNPAQKALTVRYKALVEAAPDALAAAYPEFKQRQAGLLADKSAAGKRKISLTDIRALYDQDPTPPPNHLLVRGDWTRPGDVVEPGIPAILNNPRHPFMIPKPAVGAVTSGRRLALARWIASPDNPLTARVIVNRLWARHFGVGIVATGDNFGRSGAAPTNQPLLDWMARSLTLGIQGSRPWTLKALQRLIVTSAAYRQSSAFKAQPAHTDPDDSLLWRQRPRRLEAEAIRDSILAAAGTLDPKMFGEPVGEETRPTGEIAPIGEEKGGRRSIYLLVRRSQPVTMLNAFDSPVMETNCTRRVVSTTATQALTFLNSRFVAAQARNFATRVVADTAQPIPQTATQQNAARPDAIRPDTTRSDAARAEVVRAYRLALGRPPAAGELTVALNFLRDQTALYRKTNKAPAEPQALADFCLALLSANEFIYVD